MEASEQTRFQQSGATSSSAHSSASSKHQECPSKIQQSGVCQSLGKQMGEPSGTLVTAKLHRSALPIANGSPGIAKTAAFKSTTTKADEEGIAGKGSNSTSSHKAANAGSATGASMNNNSILRIGPRLRAEGLMVPPASDAATLRRQVAALQLDLEAHIDGEQRLQSINQQLRERLELYMKQNHENVERAERELNALHEDMEQTLELQRRLAQRASALEKEKKELEQALQKSMQKFEAERSALQSKISSLTDDLNARADAESQALSLQAEMERTLEAKYELERKIQSYYTEAESLKQKADNYSKELYALMSKERQNQMIEKHCRKPLMRRTFHWFRDAIERQCISKSNEIAALVISNKNFCRRTLQAMKTATIRSRRIRQAFKRRSKACLQEVWRAWLLTALADKKYHDALQHRQRSCICKSISKWKSLMDMGKLSIDEEKRLTELAKRFWRNCVCRRVLKKWLWWIDFLAKPKKTRLTDVRVHIDRLTIRQTIAAWRFFIRLSRARRMKLEQAFLKEKFWRQQRTFSRWQEGILVLRYERLLTEKALQFSNFCRCRIVVKNWCKFLQIRRHRKISQALAFRHYIRSLQSKVLAVWKYNVKFQQAEIRAILEVNQALMKAAMIFWREYHVLCAVRQKKEQKADAHRRRRTQKIAKAVLVLWWEEMAWRRRASQLERLLASQRRRTLLVISLHCWMRSTFNNLLVANAKVQNELLEAKALFEEQKQQTTAVDVENLQLIDRLHMMSSEIAYLKMTITEKEKQENDLHRALEDGAFIESSMRGELEQQHIRIEELEMDILTLQKKLQMKNAEDTAEEVHYTLEIQNMEQAVKDLQIELAEKTSHLKSYEKALQETAEKLEGASDESQEKLSSAFEIASSLRKLLKDRENQYAALEGNCRRRELELGEVQRKLAVANNTFSETVEARDFRIRELENMLAQKQAEIYETQQETQDLQVALDAKDNLVRKLEYEIKLKSDQELHRSKNFVSSLSTWPIGQCDASSGVLRSNVHSIQLKESMRHVYTQAKAALQGGEVSEGANCLRLPSSKLQKKAAVHWESVSGSDQDTCDILGDQQAGEEVDSPESLVGEAVHQDPCPAAVLEKAATLLASYKDIATERAASPNNFLHTIEVPEQESGQSGDWETSFSLFSSTRPSPGDIAVPFGLEPERTADESTLGRTGSEGSPHTGVNGSPGAVDGLHVEIQRLQARILSQLRDSQSEEKSRTSSQQRGSKGQSNDKK